MSMLHVFIASFPDLARSTRCTQPAFLLCRQLYLHAQFSSLTLMPTVFQAPHDKSHKQLDMMLGEVSMLC